MMHKMQQALSLSFFQQAKQSLKCPWYLHEDAKDLILLWLTHFSVDWVILFVRLIIGVVLFEVPNITFIRSNAKYIERIAFQRIQQHVPATFIQYLGVCTLCPDEALMFLNNLPPLTDIQCLHLYKRVHHGHFGPTIFEALAILLEFNTQRSIQ
jgi:hypothetical protein